MFAVYTLFLSFLLIIGLFSLRYWEMKSGRRFFAEERRKADALVTEYIPHLHRRAVKTGKEISREAVISGLHYITTVLLRIVRAIEQRLANMVNIIRGRDKVAKRGNASSFLMKVSEHKKVNGSKTPRFSKNAQ